MCVIYLIVTDKFDLNPWEIGHLHLTLKLFKLIFHLIEHEQLLSINIQTLSTDESYKILPMTVVL